MSKKSSANTVKEYYDKEFKKNAIRIFRGIIEEVRIMSNFHTVETLRNKLNELIEQGYEDYEVTITYDNGHGVTSAHKEVDPKIQTSSAYGNMVIFAEDDGFVKGF